MRTLLTYCPGSKCDPCKPPPLSCTQINLKIPPVPGVGGNLVSFQVAGTNPYPGGPGWAWSDSHSCNPLAIVGLKSSTYGLAVAWNKYLVPPDWTGTPGVLAPDTISVAVAINVEGGGGMSISGTVKGQDAGTIWAGFLDVSQFPNGTAMFVGTPPRTMTIGQTLITMSVAGGQGIIGPNGETITVEFHPAPGTALYYA